MKHFYLVFCLLIAVSCTRQQKPGTDIPKLKEELSALLDQWYLDAAEARHEAYISRLANDGVFIGTDATEYWTTPEFSKWSKPYFDKGDTWKLKKVKRNIYLSEDQKTAWWDEILTTRKGLARGSGVLVKTDSAWLIRQYVLSATIPNDIINTVYLLKKETDSLLLYDWVKEER